MFAACVKSQSVDDKELAFLSTAPRLSVRRCALSFLNLVCESIPGGPRLVDKHGGLEAIDDVHYSGQVMCFTPVPQSKPYKSSEKNPPARRLR